MSPSHRSVYQSDLLIPEIISLFQSVFRANIAPELLSPEFLAWKYFEQRPDWRGSRSFSLRQDGALVAHACAWPVAFEIPAGEIRGIHILDWLAQPGVPGAGVAIYRGLMELADVTIAIGGSGAARKLLPKLGFRRYGDFRYFATVVRPLAQFRARPKYSVAKEVGRLVRNSFWAMPPLPKIPPRWYVRGEACRNSRINYLLNCPIGKCRLYSVTDDDNAAHGHFILNEVRGQTRIIELSADESAWESVFCLALRTAAHLPGTYEVVAASSLPWLDALLRRCGMRERGLRPVHVYDPRGLLADALPLNLQMTHSDAFFLYNPSYPFLT